jgi:hypothetical protein
MMVSANLNFHHGRSPQYERPNITFSLRRTKKDEINDAGIGLTTVALEDRDHEL